MNSSSPNATVESNLKFDGKTLYIDRDSDSLTNQYSIRLTNTFSSSSGKYGIYSFYGGTASDEIIGILNDTSGNFVYSSSYVGFADQVRSSTGSYTGFRTDTSPKKEVSVVKGFESTLVSPIPGSNNSIYYGFQSIIGISDSVNGPTAYGFHHNTVSGIISNKRFAFFSENGISKFNNSMNQDSDFIISGSGDANLFFVDSSLNVLGIGTATPNYKLDVIGDIRTSTLYRVGATAGWTGTFSADGQIVQVIGGIITSVI